MLPKGQVLFSLLSVLHASVSVPGPHLGLHPIRGPWASPWAPPGPAGSQTYPDMEDGGNLGRKGSGGGPLTVRLGRGVWGGTTGRSALSPTHPLPGPAVRAAAAGATDKPVTGELQVSVRPGCLLRGPVLSVHHQPKKLRALASHVCTASPGWERRVSPECDLPGPRSWRSSSPSASSL